MRSMTLSCDSALMRSDWRRLWPLAFGYAVVWLCVLPLSLWSRRDYLTYTDELHALQNINEYVMGCAMASVIISACFAVLLAMALYAYLMNSRSVGLMHALPMRRGRQLYVHFFVGVQMFTVVHLVVAVLALLVQSGLGAVCLRATLEWLVVAEVTCLFFFALASLCAMVTGWLLAVPVIYAGVNFMFAALYLLFSTVTQMYCWGTSGIGWPAWVDWLTPTVRLFTRVNDTVEELIGTVDGNNVYLWHLSASTWRTLLIYTLVAVVFVAATYFFYRLRHSETAGDAIVFPWLRPIVLYAIALAGGMGLGLLLWALLCGESGGIVALILCEIFAGLLVYFAVQMLLQKSFKVFNRRSWLGAAALAAALAVVSLCARFDVFNVEGYVPRADRVESVHFYSYGAFSDGEDVSDSEQTEKITAIHRAIVEQGEGNIEAIENATSGKDPNCAYLNASFRYTMKSGASLWRYYGVVVERGTPLYDALNALYSDEDYRRDTVAEKYHYLDEATQVISGGYVNIWGGNNTGVDQELTRTQARRLYDALQQYAQRKADKSDDLMDVLRSDTSEAGVYLEFFYETERDTAVSDGEIYVDVADSGSFGVGDLPADCTEVLELLVEFGFAESVASIIE